MYLQKKEFKRPEFGYKLMIQIKSGEDIKIDIIDILETGTIL